jgi:ABC-type antimicrobial peptide transport system permease subunit
VRSATDPDALVPTVRRLLRQIDPEIAVGQPRVLADLVADATAGRRYQSQLFVAFGVVALFIATLGVYAVTAYSVSRRRREMNIRVALGARPAEVIGLLVRQTGVSIATGIALGVGTASLLGGTLAALLFAVQPRDPLVFGGVSAVVALIALGATLMATRQGLAINPVAALRDE